MSIAAMTWAFGLSLKPSSLKFLLVALADNADDQGRAFPSIECLVNKTSQDRKTVIAGLDNLEKLSLVTDTGNRVGKTKQVKVYRLERFVEAGNSTVNGIIEGPANRPVNGTGPENGTVPNFPSNSTEIPANSTVFPSKESQKRNPESSGNRQKEPSENRQSARVRPAIKSKFVPEAFEVTEAMREWAKAECPSVDVDTETKKFRDHEFRDPHTDWQRAWRRWMRQAPDFKPRMTANSAAAAAPTRTWRPPPDEESDHAQR